MTLTAAKQHDDVAALTVERRRLAADLLTAESEWNRLDAAGDPASFLRAEPIARRIEDTRRRIAALDERIAARRELDALVADLRQQFETEVEQVADIAAALVGALPSEEEIRSAYVRGAQIRRLAAELSELTGQKFRSPDPIADLFTAVVDLRVFLDVRLAPRGQKPEVPAVTQRAQLDRARELSRP